jgi:hypothetical protein
MARLTIDSVRTTVETKGLIFQVNPTKKNLYKYTVLDQNYNPLYGGYTLNELVADMNKVEATTTPAPQTDLENCDDLQNIACSLTSEIDQNPLWDGRVCELTCEVPNIETYRYYIHTDTGIIPVESIADSEETFANSVHSN